MAPNIIKDKIHTYYSGRKVREKERRSALKTDREQEEETRQRLQTRWRHENREERERELR